MDDGGTGRQTGTETASESRSRVRRAILLAEVGAIAVGIGLIILLPRYQLDTIPTIAMSPTIIPGQVVVEDTSPADGAEVRRGEVVRILPEGWDDAPPELAFTVRIVGTGGDVVACCDAGRLTVNGQPVDEEYAQGAADTYGEFRVDVPPERVFVLGDARDVSMDSRVHLDTDSGTLATTSIQSRVEAVVWPLWEAQPVNHTGAFDEPASGGPVPAYLVGFVVTAFGLVLWLVAAARPARRAWSGTLARMPWRQRQPEW